MAFQLLPLRKILMEMISQMTGWVQFSKQTYYFTHNFSWVNMSLYIPFQRPNGFKSGTEYQALTCNTHILYRWWYYGPRGCRIYQPSLIINHTTIKAKYRLDREQVLHYHWWMVFTFQGIVFLTLHKSLRKCLKCTAVVQNDQNVFIPTIGIKWFGQCQLNYKSIL